MCGEQVHECVTETQCIIEHANMSSKPTVCLLRCAVLCYAQAAADEEPLALSGVSISPKALDQLSAAWRSVQHTSLYTSPQQLADLVQQVGPAVSYGLLLLG
jgi:hypothetical protein